MCSCSMTIGPKTGSSARWCRKWMRRSTIGTLRYPLANLILWPENQTPETTRQASNTVVEKLVVTLQSLATGCSGVSIAARNRLASWTLLKMIPEVCQAICDTLQMESLLFPSQTQWREVGTSRCFLAPLMGIVSPLVLYLSTNLRYFSLYNM